MYKKEYIFTYFDDDSAKEKRKIMSPWEIMVDDERNPDDCDIINDLEEHTVMGKSYKITIEEIE